MVIGFALGTKDPGSRTRGARWFVFKPKIQIWVNLRGSCDGRGWYILVTLGPFYSLLLYFMDIWYSGNLVYIFPFWYFVPRKIWATLSHTATGQFLISQKGRNLTLGVNLAPGLNFVPKSSSWG
jgi:hypothetical protein